MEEGEEARTQEEATRRRAVCLLESRLCDWREVRGNKEQPGPIQEGELNCWMFGCLDN